MELSMLTQLDFNINFVSSQNFLERFVQMSNTDKVTADLAEYMIEIALLDYSSIHIKPSYLALSALYLAKKIMKVKEPWSKNL
jgi:acyl carrier protein phosphodiesterase